MLCPKCARGQSHIYGMRAPFRFEGTIRQAIYELKYRNLKSLAVPLAGLLRDYLSDNPLPGNVLVPVPLHNRRLRERGYNQAHLLARELGRLTGLPVQDGCLIRHKHASPQARTATVAERHNNVAAAFSCRNPILKEREVILIDDVTTSGATLDACAAALKATGTASVGALVLAREL